ncbi:MAG: hypothetical protein ACREIV_05015, partial [Planctomycetaceae bacterium]
MAGLHPDDWVSYQSPAGWYQLLHPPRWRVLETPERLQLKSGDGRVTLILFPVWQPGDQDLSLEETAEESLGPVRRVRPAPPLPIDHPSRGVEGEVNVETKWRRWRIWEVRRGPLRLYVMLLLNLRSGKSAERQAEKITADVLSTLTVADDPAEPPELFAERVVELARRKFPLLSCEPGEDFQLRLGESSMNLHNFYRAYVQSPQRFEAIMLPALTTVVQVQEWGRDQTDPPLDRVRERIMPMLYPEAVWHENLAGYAGTSWV